MTAVVVASIHVRAAANTPGRCAASMADLTSCMSCVGFEGGLRAVPCSALALRPCPGAQLPARFDPSGRVHMEGWFGSTCAAPEVCKLGFSAATQAVCEE